MSAELHATVHWLESHGVACCLIGGAALSVRGYARYTEDTDVLVTDTRVLSADFWVGGPSPLRLARGDAEDPLAGLVELPARVEVIVGKGHAAQLALSSADHVPSRPLRVANAIGTDAAEAGSRRTPWMSRTSINWFLCSARWGTARGCMG